MKIKCRCVATCQFRGNVAEKDETYILDEERMADPFVKAHFSPVDAASAQVGAGAESPGSGAESSEGAGESAPPPAGAQPNGKGGKGRNGDAPGAVSADELPFMKEGR